MNDIDKLEEFREFDDNEYKLYNYLKSNPSVAISGVSAIVLVISFIFRALIYANECRYLKYWHFDVSMIDVYTPNRIYEYVALGFLYVIMTLYMRFIEASLEKYKEGVGLLSFERICLRGIRKEKRWLKRVRRKAKRKKEHYQETELKISRLLDKKSIVEGNKEKLKEISRIGKRKILVTLLLSVMVLTAAMCLFTLLCGNEVSLMESLGASVIMTILFWIVFCVAIKSENEKKKEYKQFDIEKKVEQYQVYINEYKKKSKQYPIDKLRGFEIKSVFCKSKQWVVITYAIIVFSSMIMAVSAQGEERTKNRKEFEVLEYENTNYVLIYKDSNYFYLEEAIIGENDNEITIYIDKQRRIRVDDISSENKVFEIINRIDGKGKMIDS